MQDLSGQDWVIRAQGGRARRGIIFGAAAPTQVWSVVTVSGLGAPGGARETGGLGVGGRALAGLLRGSPLRGPDSKSCSILNPKHYNTAQTTG